MLEKTRRQQAILELVESRELASQAALARALRRRGFRVTQSTLSRDLRELRVTRLPTAEGYRYAKAAGAAAEGPSPFSDSRLRAAMAAEVTAVAANECCVVVRTRPGCAQGVGSYLDGLRDPEILGTVAGDDTVLVLPRSATRTGRLEEKIRELFDLL